MSVLTRLGTRMKTALAGAAALALTGCIDIKATFFIDQAGMLGIEGDVKLQPELDDVMQAVEAMFALDPEGRKFAGEGLCKFLEKTAATDPGGQRLEIKTRGFKAGNRPACSLSMKFGPAQEILENIARELANLKEKVGLELAYEGTRRYRLTLDFGALHDADLRRMREGIIELLNNVRIPGVPTAPIQPAAVDRAMRKYQPMIIAMLKMGARGGEGDRIDLGVRVPRIIATNMRQDGNTARVAMSYAELIALEQNVEIKRQHVYSVVFEF
ncbi:MAG TPA: hypothetical protein PK264_06105 [Hyphomicrobiaceae bacterium]|nr:hypothetical protein [Hyphomicrobiaceae bacterium]